MTAFPPKACREKVKCTEVDGFYVLDIINLYLYLMEFDLYSIKKNGKEWKIIQQVVRKSCM
jgi:hypothetical protein